MQSTERAVNTSATASAGPPTSPCDLNASGCAAVPVTVLSPTAKSTVAGVDSICTGRSRWKDTTRPRPWGANGSAMIATITAKTAAPCHAARRSPRATSQTSVIGTSSAGNSLVAVPTPSRPRPSRGRSRASASSAAIVIAAGQASKWVRAIAPTASGARIRAPAAIGPAPPPASASRTAAQNITMPPASMSRPKVTSKSPVCAESHIGARATGGYSVRACSYGQAPWSSAAAMSR